MSAATADNEEKYIMGGRRRLGPTKATASPGYTVGVFPVSGGVDHSDRVPRLKANLGPCFTKVEGGYSSPHAEAYPSWLPTVRRAGCRT